MPSSETARPTPPSRASLLWSVSLAALVSALGAGQGRAQSVGALMAASHQATAAITAVANAQVLPASASPNTAAGMAAAAARALRNQGQLNQTLSLAQQAQAAAQKAAAAMVQTVPNGLGAGALNPVAKPVAAASDPTGLSTWQGASLPTVSASNPDDVTIVQTDPHAILSWQTFNVGRDTTLNFTQQKAGVDQPGWIVLNRVVGQLDPATGLRDPSLAPAPSMILGAIKAPGTVLVINQNGVIFGPTAQVNVGSLVASSLEIGHALEQINNVNTPLTIAQRDSEFLNFGLLGYAQQAPSTAGVIDALSPQAVSQTAYDPLLEGTVEVDAGARLASASGGFLILAAPRVLDSGDLSSPGGEVALQSGRHVQLAASEGTASSLDPDVRGLVVSTYANSNDAPDYVDIASTGTIEAPRGYVSIGSTLQGGIIDAGVISSTTSVSENGYVNLFGGNIALSPDAVIAISPDSSVQTIPQDTTSLADFKSSRVRIGDTGALIDIGADSLIYAPGANVSIGSDPGIGLTAQAKILTTRVFVDSGATIDAAGLADVVIPASRNAIKISPVKGNELANSPAFRNGFLNGATVYLDPRLSGISADGVAWTGSPLIAATAYAQQVGVSVSELMTKGGNVTLGVQGLSAPASGVQTPDVIVKAGATIDISGGWKTYQAGLVQTSQLVDAAGQVIPIADANPDDTYVAVYNGFTVNQPRWGVSRTYTDPLLSGTYRAGQYSEGLDAGSLTVKGSVVALDGTVFADAFAGQQQIATAQPGTATGTVYGDVRRLQGAPSQLPAGGYLDIQALGLTGTGSVSAGGGDISIVGGADYVPVPEDLAYGQTATVAGDGSLVTPARPAASVLPVGRLQSISLDADALSRMGLSQLTVQTSGAITVATDANVTLAAGGAFEAVAGRSITIDGAVSAPAGAIDLTTGNLGGSTLVTQALTPGALDIVVNGSLSVAGRWANDFNVAPDQVTGSAYLSGGEITLAAAPRVLSSLGVATVAPGQTVPIDDSGSILIDPGALLDASGGGYAAPNGSFILTAKGGNVSLYDDTTYFQIVNSANGVEGGVPGFRITGNFINGVEEVSVNPGSINAHVSIADGAIRANGFAGGGTFTLTAPQFTFGSSETTTGAALPLDFFSQAGFANYQISSYGTDLVPNTFDNGLGGYNAVLATQVVHVAAGQTLDLTQSIFSPLLDSGEIATLQSLATGASLYSALAPAVPLAVWDQKAVNLTLGGLLELHVDAGGQVLGSPGGSLTVSQLYNQGLIRIRGGTITQSEILPQLYTGLNVVAVHSLSDVFSTQADGTIVSGDPNALGLELVGNTVATNAEVAAAVPIYLLGDLDAGEGVRLASGSVTDLSGVAITNPHATPRGGLSAASFTDGKVLPGGSLISTNVFASGGSIFHTIVGAGVYANVSRTGAGMAESLTAQAGSVIDLAGASATFDRPVLPDNSLAASRAPSYGPILQWSDGGALTLGSGGTINGAVIEAGGGAPLALGGTLTVLDPILYQSDPGSPTFDAVSATAVAGAGFSTFVAEGGLTSVGDVTLTLPRSVFVQSPANYLVVSPDSTVMDLNSPVIGSGGKLEIDAPYIALQGAFQSVSSPDYGSAANNSVLLRANAIDVTGAVVFDRSVNQATFETTGDVRFIGVAPTAFSASETPAATLEGRLAVNGDLTIRAAQVYPTTGTTFAVTSAAVGGLISFESSGGAPATPYSAGGSLLVQAARIDQGGVLRVPLGALTLGSNVATGFAPATASVAVEAGSVTSVSADGLNIPYGATTDQVEWYFTPTSSDALTAPPAGILHIAGSAIDLAQSANVDLKGGGDVYAYEFISGTGGTRDVLDQYNPDQFSSTNGYQYPDGRQIYSIVPGLSDAQVATLDPLYSQGYSSLYGQSQAGLRVYLNGAPGLSAGWYTLLPAKYALLPGGLRVVQDTGAATPPPGTGAVLPDGTVVTSGRFGVAGVDTETSSLFVFDVQSQAVFREESRIALTSGDQDFAAAAAHAVLPVPQLPIDAGRLVLSPQASLTLDAQFDDTPAQGGRGSQVDISGTSLAIVSASSPAATPPDSIVLTDASLARLDAASLLLGGVRTDNADGTTSLDVTSDLITVTTGARLTEPELIMVTDGTKANVTIADGASIVATGAVTNESSGAYVVDGAAFNEDGVQQTATGVFVRVSNGPERLLVRDNVRTKKIKIGVLSLGAADLSGDSIELNSYGQFKLGKTDPTIEAQNLAIGAGNITFGAKGAGLVVNPQLQALFGQAKRLTLQSPHAIVFSAGDYDFGDLRLDSPGLRLTKGAAVAIDAADLTFFNDYAATKACTVKGPLACGAGLLTLTASQIAFGSGVVHTYGAGGGVALHAATGVYADGAGTFAVGAAPLAIDTPFIGDRGSGLPDAVGPDLTLITTGTVTIANPTPTVAITAPQGTPGAGLIIEGQSVSVTGTELRATAGALRIQSATGISLASAQGAGAGGVAVTVGALLATPGYSKVFGDSADSTAVSAPGGTLSLIADDGNIDVSAESRLSIGGGEGAAGTLSLVAQKGEVRVVDSMGQPAVDAAGHPIALDTTFEASAPDGGAALSLDTGGAFDLSAFIQADGAVFNGDIAVRTASGDLQLQAGDILKARSVQLVADGGAVEDAGQIDTSGVNGGDVSLYGATGVQLASTAVIKAQASGYAATDTRQATGGNVTVGVDGDAAIAIDQGALIDVSALRPGNRLVLLPRTDGTDYSFVAGDQGGTVTLRAPVVLDGGIETVNVTVAGGVTGASSVVLEGFQRWNLGALGQPYAGVSIVGGQAVLDLTKPGAGGVVNFLGADGPVAGFIRAFDVSADYGALGSLATQANFHAQPGVELDYSGGIVLNSNWNLGAGVVDVAGAVAAGLMVKDPGLPGQYAVVPGDEGQILADFTSAIYRVGGTFAGEPGVLTIRAGGGLDLKGSISDGFFTFGDQTDPGYLNYALGGGDRTYQGVLQPTLDPSTQSVAFTFPDRVDLAYDPLNNPQAPYSAAANSPAALGPMAGGGGDPLGSAELFPLLPMAGGGGAVVGSWSYQLVAGADVTGAGGQPSVDPLITVAGSDRSVIIEGQHEYSYHAVKGTSVFADALDLQDSTGASVAASDWEAAYLAQNPGLTGGSAATIDWSGAPLSSRPVLKSWAKTYFTVLHPGSGTILPGGLVETTVSGAAGFMTYVSDHFNGIAKYYKAPTTPVATGTAYAVAPTLVRTGTGSIDIEASGDIDLRNGAKPTILTATGKLKTPKAGTSQLGGTAVYTAGHVAQLGTVTATDAAGATYSVDLATNAITANVFASNPQDGYTYGAGNSNVAIGFTGILIGNPVYADGGGSVTLDAGLDVLGRRDTFQENRLGGVGTLSSVSLPESWIGDGAQPWRTGSIGQVVNARLDPQLFGEGVGALAGGDVTVRADRDVSDLSVVASDTLTTGAATPGADGGVAGAALVTLGGGNVTVAAGRNILGGRVDVASGEGQISAFGDIASAGVRVQSHNGQTYSIANTLRIQLADATVAVSATGSVDVQGISALGVKSASLNSTGFYSADAGVSILADRAVQIDNAGVDVVTPAEADTDNTSAAVYPGTLTAISVTGALEMGNTGLPDQAIQSVLYPSATGTLTLLAGGDIAPLTIAQLDSDPTLLPGAFSSFTSTPSQGVTSGVTFVFPTVLPNTSDVVLRGLHNPDPTHAGDPVPNRIVAGDDIVDTTISTAKQTRIAAGVDIINMIFEGQNLAAGDVTRITAGRDITATTALELPVIDKALDKGPPLPAIQGDTFILGGPGSLFIEAGRDAGPFLNSAVTDGYAAAGPSNATVATGVLTYGGGVISVGNQWNPWLPAGGAQIFTEFGVAKGADFSAVVSSYLNPANFSSAPGYLFEQTKDANGNLIPDRSEQIYALTLEEWIKAVAPDVVDRYDTSAGVNAPSAQAPAYIQYLEGVVKGQPVSFQQAMVYLPDLKDLNMPLIPWLLLNQPAALTSAFGDLDVTYAQAFTAFEALPQLTQREFLLKNVYFNELIQTSIPTSPSYLKYSRGYQAVNALFPGALGYTQNSLNGGPAGASTTVETGNLDLRLATIQTEQGGDIVILGPGGRVLAGSTVSTSAQAARRAYIGGALYAGGLAASPYTSNITQIPPGYEGVLTLDGGSIDSFTDGDFLLNQSRAFTEAGGDVALWSSNADVNAGQGPRTTADVPPVQVRIDENGFATVNTTGAVSGAGIGAFQPDTDALAPAVFLIAPRGTVDAGDAGVRSAGNVFIAAYAVANANAISAVGSISGIATSGPVDVAGQTSGNAAATAAAQAAQAMSGSRGDERPLIVVDVLGYIAGESESCDPEDAKRGVCQ